MSSFHSAYMVPTASAPAGYFRHGPPNRAAATEVRANRCAAMKAHHPRQHEQPGVGWGADACAWCWLHNAGASKCRVVGAGSSGHGREVDAKGRGGADFDSTLVGKTVTVTQREGHARDPAFEGTVTAFDAASGEHTIATVTGEVKAFLSYFSPKRLAIHGALRAARSTRGR